jgi:hypothetical protein
MIRNLLFALLFAYFVTNCAPKQYFDSTGRYTQIKGKEYIREGDTIKPWGQRVYVLKKDKTTNTFSISVTKR